MRKQSQIFQYPSPTDRSSIGSQFSFTYTNAHAHTGGDSPQIQYRDLLGKPTIQPHGISALGTTGAVNLNPALGNVFTITPTGATQINPTAYPAGYIIVVRVLTSGTTSYTITFNTGFVANGTLSTGTLDSRYFSATFVCDGTYWIELSRTPAMLPT